MTEISNQATVSGSNFTPDVVTDDPDTVAVDDPTVTPLAIFIRDLQGLGHVSPRNGQAVTDIPGIVTALRSDGFDMQNPDPDADPATSEGIFVFTSSAPTVSVGDRLTVSGTVDEFRQGGAGSTNLSVTQITSPTGTTVSTGNPLPGAVVIGTGGRIPPAAAIDDDSAGDVDAGTTFDPASDGIDFYESMEGMRVQLNDAIAVRV